MIDTKENLLSKLGFRFGTNGPHAARTMMLEDLRVLLNRLPADATREQYAEEVVGNNALGKPTKKARELAFRHLVGLYELDTHSPLFRALRRLWSTDITAQPVLALTVALARDPLLRCSQSFIQNSAPGTPVTREEVERLLAEYFPNRFSAASLKSFAQNVNGTWTAAGFLVGRNRKSRSAPIITPANVVLCLFLGHLEGLSGQRLFTTSWMNLLASEAANFDALAASASHRGLLVYMSAGGVKEVRFPDYLTPEEEQIRQELSHVI